MVDFDPCTPDDPDTARLRARYFASNPAEAAEVIARTEPGPRCESGWTGDRCVFPLFHDGPHSNDTPADRELDRLSNPVSDDDLAERIRDADDDLLSYAR